MIKTLIVDGNNLLKIGVCGVKDFYNNGEHVGGIWYFLNTIRKFLEESNFNKVVVCWDSQSSSTQRRLFYPKYKINRKLSDSEDIDTSFLNQKTRVKQYLEEMFIRHIEIENCEADDIIAYYCKISEDENKVIFSSDRDLTQLISENVTIYSPSTKKYYKNGDMIKMFNVEIPHFNVKTWKIISGDKSDNIFGIYYLGEKTLIKLFPELLDKEVNITDILKKGEKLLKEDKGNLALINLLTGRTKEGIFGNEFYDVNKKLVDLSEPLISEDDKKIVNTYYSESMDPDGRGHKNIIKMMMKDGLFNYLPKNDDSWVKFLTPFLKLTRKEKTKFKTKN